MLGRFRGKKRLEFVGFTEGGLLKKASEWVSPPSFLLTVIIFRLGYIRTQEGRLMPKVTDSRSVGELVVCLTRIPASVSVSGVALEHLGYSETLCLS